MDLACPARSVNRLTVLNESSLLPALLFLQNFEVPFWSSPSSADFDPFVTALFAGVDMRDFMDKVRVVRYMVYPPCQPL